MAQPPPHALANAERLGSLIQQLLEQPDAVRGSIGQLVDAEVAAGRLQRPTFIDLLTRTGNSLDRVLAPPGRRLHRFVAELRGALRCREVVAALWPVLKEAAQRGERLAGGDAAAAAEVLAGAWAFVRLVDSVLLQCLQSHSGFHVDPDYQHCEVFVRGAGGGKVVVHWGGGAGAAVPGPGLGSVDLKLARYVLYAVERGGIYLVSLLLLHDAASSYQYQLASICGNAWCTQAGERVPPAAAAADGGAPVAPATVPAATLHSMPATGDAIVSRRDACHGNFGRCLARGLVDIAVANTRQCQHAEPHLLRNFPNMHCADALPRRCCFNRYSEAALLRWLSLKLGIAENMITVQRD